MKGRVLVVASSDSSGGTGIPADIKAVTALKGYAMPAITAITAQNTTGVHGVLYIPPEFVAPQMRVVLQDLGADAVKVGLVLNAGVVDAIANVLEADAKGVPLVLDPIFTATGGTLSLDDEGHAALTRRLAFVATLLTPNLEEAVLLCGGELITTLEEQCAAAEMLRTIGSRAVLIKGGHGTGPEMHDVLATADGVEVFSAPRVDTQHTRGIGSTLAAAIATGLAQGMELRPAIQRARAYVRQALAAAPGHGQGRGALNHSFAVAPFAGE